VTAPASSWTTPDGRVLASVAAAAFDGGGHAPADPLRIALRRPSTAELAERFDEARAWIAALRTLPPQVLIEYQTINHRLLGTNEVPRVATVASADDLAAAIGKTRDLARFRAIVSSTRERVPALRVLLERRPLEVLEAHTDWDRILDVIEWMRAHPRPGIYIRQLDLVGVDTKFVEVHQKLLAYAFDQVLSDDDVDTAVPPNRFARRYGFRERPRVVRYRLLDPSARAATRLIDADVTCTAADFAVTARAGRVFITENETNFLAFPDAVDAVVVFGAGSGFEHLADVGWLLEVPIHYWGDIDTHGFAILDQVRAALPHAQSMLMDRATLDSHSTHWGNEPTPTRRDLTHLTEDEAALYDALRTNAIRNNLRLEQERVRFRYVRAAVEDTLR
jgi:hypothetical protein